MWLPQALITIQSRAKYLRDKTPFKRRTLRNISSKYLYRNEGKIRAKRISLFIILSEMTGYGYSGTRYRSCNNSFLAGRVPITTRYRIMKISNIIFQFGSKIISYEIACANRTSQLTLLESFLSKILLVANIDSTHFYRVHVNLTTLNIFFFYLIKINSSWKLDQSKENLQMADTNENLCTFIIHFAEYLRLISIDFHSPFFPFFFKFTLTRPRIPRKIYIYRKRFAFLLFRLMNSALPFQNETVIFVLWWS